MASIILEKHKIAPRGCRVVNGKREGGKRDVGKGNNESGVVEHEIIF